MIHTELPQVLFKWGLNYFYTITKWLKKGRKHVFRITLLPCCKPSIVMLSLILFKLHSRSIHKSIFLKPLKRMHKQHSVESRGNVHYQAQKKRMRWREKLTNYKTLRNLLVIFSTWVTLGFTPKLKHHFLNNNTIHFFWHHKRMLLRHKKFISLM